MARRRSSSSTKSKFKTALKWAFVGGLWMTMITIAILAWYARELPELIENPQFERKASVTVLANDGSVIGRYGDIKGNSLKIQELPKHLIEAILATEDRRFYYHFGLDPIGLARAIVVNMTRGGVVQGGSTITQQLAKNLFLTHERTYKRKIQEALLALWLEKELTKDEILSAYLNRVYMGAGAYGVDAASRIYFHKAAKNLNLRESAMLAGLLKAPSRYSPLANPKEAEARAKVVISAMVDAGFLTEAQAKKGMSKKANVEERTVEGESSRYFADWVMDNLEDLIGRPTEDVVVQTTLDPEIQNAAAKVLKESIEKNGEKVRAKQAASIVMRPDGRVLAMVGGIDYKKSQFNRTVQALRQPGSSFKPVVYLAAVEKGVGPEDLIDDAPITEGRYRPQNFGHKYYGTVRIIDALTLSLNTVSFRLAQYVGINEVIGVARRLGITADLEPNLALALGSSGVPMIEMAQAYGTLANGGYGVTAFGILSVKTEKSKKVLYQRQDIAIPKVFRSGDIETMSLMMQSVVQNGTGAGAAVPFFAAGKTGTSQDYRDAWFDGFTNQYVAVVWFGNDDNSSMKSITGGSLPAQAWKQIILAAHADPTPAKYRVIRSTDHSADFGGMLDRLIGDSPNLLNTDGATPEDQPAEMNGTRPYEPAPESPNRFNPGTDRDRVGYQRLND